MSTHKVAIPILGEEIIPRFDLATEVVILKTEGRALVNDKQIIVLPRSSAEDLCRLFLSETITTVICGAIEDEYFQFLEWKKIEIIDCVVGSWTQAFERWQRRSLVPGDILSLRMVEGRRI